MTFYLRIKCSFILVPLSLFHVCHFYLLQKRLVISIPFLIVIFTFNSLIFLLCKNTEDIEAPNNISTALNTGTKISCMVQCIPFTLHMATEKSQIWSRATSYNVFHYNHIHIQINYNSKREFIQLSKKYILKKQNNFAQCSELCK